MSWTVVFTDRARRDLRTFDRSVAQRIVLSIDRLAASGHGNVKRLRGREQEWRLRVGDWRVRLIFEPEARTIRVLRIRHRREAYRD